MIHCRCGFQGAAVYVGFTPELLPGNADKLFGLGQGVCPDCGIAFEGVRHPVVEQEYKQLKAYDHLRKVMHDLGVHFVRPVEERTWKCLRLVDGGYQEAWLVYRPRSAQFVLGSWDRVVPELPSDAVALHAWRY